MATSNTVVGLIAACMIAHGAAPVLAALASEASGQRGHSIVRAHSASEDIRAETPVFAGLCCKRADDARPEPGSSARAADAANPDWPCVQHKVATLTAAQMWDGGDVDDRTQWRDNEQIGKLIAVLASRRIPQEQAAAAIAQFAEAQPQDQRDEALKVLFAGLLSAINRDRAVVMSGIERFQRRQKARAAEIERQGAAIRELKERAASDAQARAELTAAEERFNWDVRVFTERQQSLPLACEVPVLIEQRLFALAREIRARMSD